MHVSALVLAAGCSSRMEAANKLLLPLQGLPLLAHTLATVCAAPVANVIVVTGHEQDEVEAVLAAHPVRAVHNPDYRAGMAASIRCGVEAAGETDGYLICLGDMPLVAPVTLTRLCACFAEATHPAIVMPIAGGRRGHPVLFDAAFRGELLQLEGDTGARSVVQAHPEAVVEVAVDDPGIFRDVDTRAAYEILRQQPQDD